MLKKTVLVRALSIAFSTAALTMAVTPSVMAQSNATGVIFGHVDSAAGATVTLTNTETGFKRIVPVDASGSYRATALPNGHYKVELQRNGTAAGANEVDVVIGQGVESSFASANIASVQVTGRRNRIDVSSAVNGAVFTAKELKNLPVANNLNSIVLLAPNTTKGDAAFGNTSSFGGSGVSENSFYLNGFPITNPLSQLGSMELPFGAVQQASVMTGGFGAEFGRSIGGVMSVTSKGGTNTWETGATYSLTPSSTRAAYHNIYYPVTGDPNNTKTDGKLQYRYDNRSVTERQYGVYVGGPLIKDKLFMFVSADRTTTTDSGLGSATGSAPTTTQSNPTTVGLGGWHHDVTTDNRWLAKIDWNITDNHRIEFTSVGNDDKTRYQRYGYVLNPNNPNALAQLDGQPNNQLYTSAVAHNLGPTDPAYSGTPGATLNMARYTGNLTDDLTVTGLYGEMKTKRGTSYEQAGIASGNTGGLPAGVSWSTTGRWPAMNQALYAQHNFFSGSRSLADASDDVKAGRLDLEYKLGQHTLRAGLDTAKLETVGAGYSTSGGNSWVYNFIGASRTPTSPAPLSYSRPAIVANYGGSGTAGYYVTKTIFNSITNSGATQSAQYLEDRWQVTKDLLLTLGVRNDNYSNKNGDGVKFIEMKNQVAPRFAAAWDVNGDASFKVYGSAGRYYLQLPTQVAARAASRSTYTSQDFTYTGVDPNTGAPLGIVAINTPMSADGEYGQAKNPRSVVSSNLKPNYQDEVTLGFERAWSPDLNFGAKFTYRKLGAGIDDSCDIRPLYDFAVKNGIDVQSPWSLNCFIYNPGQDVNVWVDGNDAAGNPVVTGKGKMAHFTAAEIMEPKAKRNYTAVDVFFEHPMRNGWYGKVNYTWSRSKGNMEGQTRSDTGQTDVGTSAAWDWPEFAAGSDGLLPNDREHQLKAFGFYQLTPELTLGGNVLIQSGRPLLCLGTNNAKDGGTDPAFPMAQLYDMYPGYGAEYYYCGGKDMPRGSLGRLPWEKRLDLAMTYAPAYVKGLALKVDVFNALNSQTALNRTSTYDAGDQETIAATYGRLTSYQSPRSVKFTVEYNHKF
jgi:outer membrane receptor protein involved in Fe transport